MLILSRKINESININNEIEVKILEIRKDSVKIAVQAPKKVKVFRKELYELIKEKNKASVLEVKSEKLNPLKDVFKDIKKPF